MEKKNSVYDWKWKIKRIFLSAKCGLNVYANLTAHQIRNNKIRRKHAIYKPIFIFHENFKPITDILNKHKFMVMTYIYV